jgi:hypothetical protein
MARRATTDTVVDTAAFDHVQAVTAASGTSFYWGMRVLPPTRRHAMYAIYAFCREVDDIADGYEPEPIKLAGLAEWRAEIERLFAGVPEFLTARALLQPVRAFDLQREDFLAVIDGTEMDAREVMRAPPMAVLEQYCARVAGAVGLLSVRAFGDGSPRARGLALALGQALQLTRRSSSPTSCATSTRTPSAAGCTCRASFSPSTGSPPPTPRRCSGTRPCRRCARRSPPSPGADSRRRAQPLPTVTIGRSGRR